MIFANTTESAGLVERLMPEIISYGLKILGVIVLFIVGKWLSGRVSKMMLKRFEKREFDLTLSRFFSQLAGTFILIFTVIFCLSIFGVETTSLAALLGGAALAIGLAFQKSLSNFAAGVMLLVFRPFKVGDLIEVAGVKGVVHDVGLFATLLDSLDKKRIIVPNGSIFGSTITNLSHHAIRRVGVPVGTDYGADLVKVRDVLMKAALSVKGRVQDMDPLVYLGELGDSSIEWEVRVFSEAAVFFDVRQELILAVKQHLDAADIGIPFPQMDVHLDPGVGLPAKAA